MDWWRRRGQAVRLEWYVRGSLYGQLALSPLLIGGLVQLEVTRAALVAVVAGFVVHTVVCLRLAHDGINAYLGLREPPTALVIAGGVLTAAGVGTGFLAFPHPTPGQPDGPATAILLMLAVTYVAALSVAVRPRYALAVSAVFGVSGGLTSGAGATIALGLLLVSIVLGYRTSLWILGMVRELDRARHVQAGLAVAEERLRFAWTCTTSSAVPCPWSR